ncbi:MAG: hypothetical protein ACRDST_01335 [Pseudonocardiaceae bacterium]
MTDHDRNGATPADAHPRRVISATCTLHRGPTGFTNLAVIKRGGEIELDPHVDRSCVITLDEDGARILFEALAEWLG